MKGHANATTSSRIKKNANLKMKNELKWEIAHNENAPVGVPPSSRLYLGGQAAAGGAGGRQLGAPDRTSNIASDHISHCATSRALAK